MRRQERHQVVDHAHGPDTGPAAAVRDAESLVQVQVADVAAELARRRDADQRVHVGAVDVDTPAVPVHELAQLLDARLEHAVGRRVGDHDARQVLGVLRAFQRQVVEIDVAHRVALHHDDFQPGHLRARRVRAVRRFRDQAHVALRLPARLVPGLDREQPGVFALRAGVGLQADARIAGGLRQPAAQLLVEQRVAAQLIGRCERMDVRELRPRHRDHLARRVELHRARAERDHAAVEREVLVGQAAHVAQHLGLAVMAVEDRMREVRAGAHQLGRHERRDAGLEALEGRAAAGLARTPTTTP